MNKKQFGKIILEARKQKGITQQELAEELNVTHTAVSHWENGRYYPDVELFPRIAEILQVDVYQLFLGEETNIKQSEDERFCHALQFAGKICAKKVKRRNYVIFLLCLLCVGLSSLFVVYSVYRSAKYTIVDAEVQGNTFSLYVLYSGNIKAYNPEDYWEEVDKIFANNLFQIQNYENFYVYIYDEYQNREENHIIGELYFNLNLQNLQGGK